MTIFQATTISLRDSSTGDEATVIVRHDSVNVALCLSLRSNGDVEVVMGKEDAKRVMEALRKASSV